MSDDLVDWRARAASLAKANQDLRAEIADMKDQSDRIEALEEQVSDLLADLPCACGYDNPDDVCLKHYPLFRKQKARIEALEAALAEKEAESAKWCRYAHLYAGWVGEMTEILWDRKDDLDPDNWEDEKILELLYKAEVGVARAALNAPDREGEG